MAHKSIEKLERPIESLSSAFLEKAYIGHMDWVKKDRLTNVKTERRVSHLARAAELASIAADRAPQEQRTLFGGRITIAEQ